MLTLGTGLGTALFQEGELLPHLELAHGPSARASPSRSSSVTPTQDVGNERWNAACTRRRVNEGCDHVYIGGGNARRLGGAVGRATMIDNTAGILGGIKLWERPRRCAPGVSLR